MNVDGFWRGRRVLVTGHTGFKGAWLSLALQRLGARVAGISLAPPEGPSLFHLLAPWDELEHHEVDLLDATRLTATVRALKPQVVFHLAAQAIVLRSFREPELTFAINVNGTAHLLESLRGLPGVQAGLFITSDKVYRNEGRGRRFVESDPLGGADPYSASKAAAEHVVAAWRDSYGNELPALATARAGNVIGGGDFGESRLIPDLVRAQNTGTSIRLRNPQSTRPWQHVMDVLRGYLQHGQALVQRPVSTPTALNFGPPAADPATVGDMVRTFVRASGRHLDIEQAGPTAAAEAPHLALDSSLAASTLDWRARLGMTAAVHATADWYGQWQQGADMRKACSRAIDEALQ